MGLSVAYIQEEIYSPIKEKDESGKKLSKRETRVGLWMARQYERDYQEAIKQHMAEIREIQKSIPGWMPEKDF